MKLFKPNFLKQTASVFALAFFLIIALATSEKKPSQDPAPSDKPAAETKWTEVYTFKGSGMKKSPNFDLGDGEAKLTYSYKAPAALGAGLFTAYVVDKGKDIMKDGGIPDVMVDKSEDGESSIQKSAGSYYINVNATGDWTVTVMQKK